MQEEGVTMKTVVKVVQAVVEAPMMDSHVLEAPVEPSPMEASAVPMARPRSRVTRKNADHEHGDHRDAPNRQLTVQLRCHTLTPRSYRCEGAGPVTPGTPTGTPWASEGTAYELLLER